MSLRRPIFSLASRLERVSLCRKCLHQARPALQGRAPPPSISPRPRQFTNVAIRREKVQDPTSRSSTSSTATSTSSEQSSPAKSRLYTYEDIVTLSESPDPNRILIGPYLPPFFYFLNPPIPPSLSHRPLPIQTSANPPNCAPRARSPPPSTSPSKQTRTSHSSRQRNSSPDSGFPVPHQSRKWCFTARPG
jgi:hypothetical protein